ncbi:MAG: InlB B-repeat-containing protein [bacterium]
MRKILTLLLSIIFGFGLIGCEVTESPVVDDYEDNSNTNDNTDDTTDDNEDTNTDDDTTEDQDVTEDNEDVTTPEVTSYTITFNTNGGSSVSSVVLDEETATTTPSTPIKPFYKFIGWTFNDTEYTFGNVLTDDITIDANWISVYLVDLTDTSYLVDYTTDATLWNKTAGEFVSEFDKTNILKNEGNDASKSNTIYLRESSEPVLSDVYVTFDLYVTYNDKSSGGIKFFTNNSLDSHSEIGRIRFNDGKFDINESGDYSLFGTKSPSLSSSDYTDKVEYSAHSEWLSVSIHYYLTEFENELYLTTDIYINRELLLSGTQKSLAMPEAGMTGINFYQDSTCESIFYYDNIYIKTV